MFDCPARMKICSFFAAGSVAGEMVAVRSRMSIEAIQGDAIFLSIACSNC
jgi:hypothetical protein